MDILKVENKGKQFDAYERFYIYKATKKSVMKEQHVEVNHVLFDLIIDYDKATSGCFFN
jgi:hypothetical protein